LAADDRRKALIRCVFAGKNIPWDVLAKSFRSWDGAGGVLDHVDGEMVNDFEFEI
jgi:hypothetical protein